MQSAGRIRFVPIIIACILGVFTIPSSVEAGFGISPPAVKEDRLVPGSHIERTIYLVRGNPKTSVPINVEIESKNIKDWLSFNPGTSFTIPAGVQQFPFTVSVAVPKDAELGIYRAFIRVRTDPEAARKAGEVAIAVGGRIDVELTVGDDVVESFTIKRLELADVPEGSAPKAKITIVNSGNVPTAPSGASFELFNKFGNVRLAYAESDAFPRVQSFSEETVEVEFPVDVHLAQGEYWGDLKIYNSDNQVVKELRTVFNVTEGGLFAGLGAQVGSAGTLAGIGGALIVVLGVLFFIFRRKRARRRQ